MKTSLAVAALAVLATNSVASPRRVETPPVIVLPGAQTTGIAPADGMLVGTIEPTLLDYLRRHSNGLVEYAFAPPAWMSPAHTAFPRPASLVARLFLFERAADLGLAQPAADFVLEASEARCDGSEVVTLQQTWAGRRVDTARLSFTVRDEVVTYLEARLVEEPAALPQCTPVVLPGQVIEDVYYAPGNERTVVIVVTVDQLQGPVALVKRNDACTGDPLGWSQVYR